jgi:hypothetical protein
MEMAIEMKNGNDDQKGNQRRRDLEIDLRGGGDKQSEDADKGIHIRTKTLTIY